jgi:monoamine oxidase
MTSGTSSAERHEVIVLGGGAAGLAAASALAANGVDVVVLEARARFGGRICTLDARDADADEPVELGAEFVHGEAPRTTALANDARVELVEPRSSTRWSRGGALVAAPELERSMEEAEQAAVRVATTGDDLSFAAALARARPREPGLTLALEYVQSFQAADAARISARALAKGDLGEERTRRVTAGYERLVEALARRLPAGASRLGAIVHEVRWSRGSAVVSALSSARDNRRPEFACERLVVSLPIGPLANVRFDPGLETVEAKARALGGLTVGEVVRLVLRFREPFWRDRTLTPAFFHVPGAEFPVFWTGPRAGSKVLVAWAGGPAAAPLRGLGPTRLADSALAALAHVFAIRRSALDDLLRDAHSHDWTSDPFALGAYSYPLVGGSEAGASLAAPIDDTLFFAGEATAPPPANGTVEGALESGFRAADEVLRSRSRGGAQG